MKLVIVTRTKDRPMLLARALQSVHSQDFKEYMHVIVNDGGDEKAIDDLVAGQPDEVREQITVYHRPLPSGAPDTIFNEAIDRVDSEYFAIHDDDDTWHPEFLSRMVKHLDENQGLGAAVARADKIIEEVTEDAIKHKKRTQWMPEVKVINLYRQCIDNQLTPGLTLYRRSAYEAIGKFREDLPVVADWEYGVRLLSRYDVGFVDPGYALANYHHRKTGQVSSHEKHRYYTNKIMNEYLRKELAEGRLGVGYIMSQLKYNQSNIAAFAKRLAPQFLIDKAKRRVQN